MPWSNSPTRNREVKRIEAELGEDIETAFANQKYGFIAAALKETYTPSPNERVNPSDVIDIFVTHKVWGFPIFFLLMGVMFYCTFHLGAYPQEWIEMGVEWLSETVRQWLPNGVVKDLVVDGVVGGVGSVIVFLPNIMILYLFISFMEDSGYLARAAFIMDRVMHKMGLHGKSFIPLIMGFGCNVPAIMATRTFESPDHHPDHARYLLLGPSAGLYPSGRHLLCRLCRIGHARSLCAGDSAGDVYGPSSDAPLCL